MAAIYEKAFSAAITLNPNTTGMPGMPVFQKLVNYLAGGVLLCLVAGALVGVAQWGLGSRSHQISQAANGKRTVGICIGGVFLIGALAAFFNFALEMGGTVRK